MNDFPENATSLLGSDLDRFWIGQTLPIWLKTCPKNWVPKFGHQNLEI